MEYSEEEITKQCRICDALIVDEDFVFLLNTDNSEKTTSGELYEELIELRVTDHENYKFLCSGCDLQIKLFKRLKDKAWKKWANVIEIDLLDTPESNHLEEDTFSEELDTDDQTLKESDAGSNNSTLYFENNEADVHTIRSGASIDACNNQNDNFMILYDLKNQSLESIDVEHIIEEVKENSENVDNIDENQILEVTVYDNALPLTSNKIEKENEKHSNIAQKQEKEFAKRSEISCKDCELTFPNVRLLKKHRQNVHCRRTHLCTICQKLFKTSENLQGHMRQHQGLPAFACEACSKTFKQKIHYQYHMKRHTNQRDFACTLCPKSYLSKSDLTMHVKRTHEDDRNFVCSIQNCGKRFYFEQHLKYHSFVHTGKRNYECDECKQKFVAPNALVLHKKTIHSLEHSFACEDCGKTFRRKHHLQSHAAVHEKKAVISSSGENYTKNIKEKTQLLNNEIKDFEHCANVQSEDTDFMIETIENYSETESESFMHCS